MPLVHGGKTPHMHLLATHELAVSVSIREVVIG